MPFALAMPPYRAPEVTESATDTNTAMLGATTNGLLLSPATAGADPASAGDLTVFAPCLHNLSFPQAPAIPVRMLTRPTPNRSPPASSIPRPSERDPPDPRRSSVPLRRSLNLVKPSFSRAGFPSGRC